MAAVRSWQFARPRGMKTRRTGRRAAAVAAAIKNSLMVFGCRKRTEPPPNLPTASAKKRSSPKKRKTKDALLDAVLSDERPVEMGAKPVRAVTLSSVVKPDQGVTMPSSFRVVEIDNVAYSAMLTRANVTSKTHDFVFLQVLWCADKYYLWTRSARIGTAGQTNLDGPLDIDCALLQFHEEFATRTGHRWDQRHSQQFHCDQFTWIEEDSQSKEPQTCSGRRSKKLPLNDSTVAVAVKSSSSSSSLHPSVHDFLMIISVDSTTSACPYTGHSTMTDMVAATLLTRRHLSLWTIKRGFDTLCEIYATLRGTQSKCVVTLSSQYYSIIPFHSGLHPIDSFRKLHHIASAMTSVTEHLSDTEVLFQARQLMVNDYMSNCMADLKCTLHVVDPASDEYRNIKKYARSGGGSNFKLLHVLRVEKPAHDRRFQPYKSWASRRLLWHGSPLNNWQSILTKGLVTQAAGMVGIHGVGGGQCRGIFFSDLVSKSLGYCRGGPINVLLLSEVALEKDLAQEIRRSGRFQTAGCETQWNSAAAARLEAGLGDYLDEDGVLWPLGSGSSDAQAKRRHHSNEYVIYNEAQARMRYVVVMSDRTQL